MKTNGLTRRDFLLRSTAIAGAAWCCPVGTRAATAGRRTAADQVTLGRSGLKLSRLGIGVGSNSGNVQRSLGQDGFNRLIRHAYDRGITYIDTADSYKTHTWVREAIKGLPREKFFIQSKIGGNPQDPLKELDRFRTELNTDYIDSLLIHCTVTHNWTGERQRVMDAIAEAQSRQWLRIRGVSCHSLPALQLATGSDWVQTHLVRINPQGAHMDTPAETWNATSNESHIPPVVEQLRKMREAGHGIIGMKLCGNGDFKEPEQREKAMRYVMQSNLCDAVVIGFKSPAEVDEAIERMDRALAEA